MQGSSGKMRAGRADMFFEHEIEKLKLFLSLLNTFWAQNRGVKKKRIEHSYILEGAHCVSLICFCASGEK